jgi:beta-galactosidase
MQDFLKRLDPTRPVTAAENVGNHAVGLAGALEVRGWNYNFVSRNNNTLQTDAYHKEHPTQPNVGTEQGSTVSTRGIYANDAARGYVSAYDENAPSWAHTAETWWSHFAARPWLSGGYVWTGFDYRGEPTPYSWPCISSHFGVLDTCGFPKDNFYYYQSWWTTNTVLHLLPHWNWPGREGQEIRVDALSNCEEVELILNGQSLGRQVMRPNSKLTWQVKYAAGTMRAKGYRGGKAIAEAKVETTGPAVALRLTRDVTGLSDALPANGESLAIFTVAAVDAHGRAVPVAQNKVNFQVAGAGRIIGVGNGDPSCHEPDTVIPTVPVRSIPVTGWRWNFVNVPQYGGALPEYATDWDDSQWKTIRLQTDGDTGEMFLRDGQTAVFRAQVKLTEADLANPAVQLRFAGIDDEGKIYVNGERVGESSDWQESPRFDVKKVLRPGVNVIAVGVRNHSGPGGLKQDVNLDIVTEALPGNWERSLFNGLAQVIVQAQTEPGEVKLTASAAGLQSAEVTVVAQPAVRRPHVP